MFYEAYSSCGQTQPTFVSQNWVPKVLEWQLHGSSDITNLVCQPETRLNGVPAGISSPLTHRTMTPGSFVTYGMSQSVNADAWGAFTSTPGQKTAAFSIDCGPNGRVAWEGTFKVLPASPADRDPGVSVDDGADFTNSTRVRLFLGWESGSLIDRVKVSNDGGFAPSKTQVFELTGQDPVPWNLVSLGNERLPKTVYVKFGMAGLPNWYPQTYTDDIILDTVRPQVLSASLSGSGAATLAGPRMVRVKAKDNKSGLASIQVSAGKPKKKAKVLKFRQTVPAPKASKVFVRVRDGAGNWSKWRIAG